MRPKRNLSKSQIKAKKIQDKFSFTFSRATDVFSSNVRVDVRTLYAFLRSADEFVDKPKKQDLEGFKNFKDLTFKSLKGNKINNDVIEEFAKLAKHKKFKSKWINDFFKSMEMDTYKNRYKNFDELKAYTWGSAEVVGLMMARILELPKNADEAAILLGRSFQLANFIRDIGEDLKLGRIYMPQNELKKFKLPTELKLITKDDEKNFKKFIEFQINRYKETSDKAQITGFKYLDIRSRIAIATAEDRYDKTLEEIKKNPLIVFKTKVKPKKQEVVISAILNVYKQSIKHIYEKATERIN